MTAWDDAVRGILPAEDLAEADADAEMEFGLSREEELMNIMREDRMPPFFDDHLYDTASYFKDVSGCGAHRIMMQQCYTSMKNHPFGDYQLQINLDKHVRREIAFLLSILPSKIWDPFVELDKQVFITTVKAAATFVYLVYPKEILCSMTANRLVNDSNKQLNHLWEQLVNFHQHGPSLQQVYCFIVQLIQDTDKYSLLTETHVSSMLRTYSNGLINNKFDLPYAFVGSPDPDPDPAKVPLFSEILEVVHKMEFVAKMGVGYYTSLLIKIIKEDDREWLLPLLVDDTQTVNLQKPHFLPSLNNLVYNLINIVCGKIMSRLLDVVKPLQLLCYPDFDYFRVSPEILDIIKVAELHRLALGSRFINRSHLIWAFYERGHSFPPGIINRPLVDECHPPYHIYLASMKLAELFGDKLRLENFVYAVLSWNGNDCDESKVVSMQEDYKNFLEALRHTNLEKSIDLGGPIFIKAYPEILRDTSLEFNIGILDAIRRQ